MRKFGGNSNFKPSKIRDVPPGQPFVQLWVELLESTALRSLDRYGHLVLLRLEVEHCRHAGKENGYLIVTYDQFVDWGVPRRAIKPTIDHLVKVGLLVLEHRGRGHAGDGDPSLYRLTYLKSKFLPVAGSPYFLEPTNDWKKFEAKPEVSKLRRDKPRGFLHWNPEKQLSEFPRWNPASSPIGPQRGGKTAELRPIAGFQWGNYYIHYGVLGAGGA